MIRCYLDDKEIEISQEDSIAISLSIASVTKIESGRTGYSKTIRVPLTASNRMILGETAEIHSPERFNQQQHRARIEAEGCTVIEGTAMLNRCERTENGTVYLLLNIIGAGKAWITNASEKMFNELELPFEASLNADTVYRSWSWEKPVRFFPVQRDRFSLPQSTLQEYVRILTFSDYYPFLHVKSVMEAIAQQTGYTICSTFMESALFGSLYLSGRYPEKETGILEERMGFVAKRFSEVSASADRYGRVYADPLTPLHSVGNLVESADPNSIQAGQTLSDVYNRNGCFQQIENRIAFVPVQEVMVGFEYTLQYRSDYKIASREELKCFNRIYLEDETERSYQVINRYEDRKASFRSGWGYLLIVFDHVAGDNYRFTYDRPALSGNTAENETVVGKEFSSRTTSIEIALGVTASTPQLWLQNAEGAYDRYTGDWALYDGYVTESGQIDLSVTLRSAARRVLPSAPRFFDEIHFGGAEQGMQLTLSNTLSLTPLFGAHPCEGTQVTFAEVAAHEIRQIEFVNAIKQLFNLYFYTDTLSKTIYIEPRESFYTDREVDWSEKIDKSRPIKTEEIGSDLSRFFTLCYQSGDGTVARWDSANKEIMGRWSAPIYNLFAKEGEGIYRNALFTASRNETGSYPDAPSASLLQVGDRDRQGEAIHTENLNFPPKIVRYTGLQTLPQEERWGWPAYSRDFPMIAYHHTGTAPFTLCFEDRDGISGLHTFYDKTIETYNASLRITLYLHLTPEEIEPFIRPHDLLQDFRAQYKLRINGEDLYCRLEEIIDYQPGKRGSTQCVFIKNV